MVAASSSLLRTPSALLCSITLLVALACGGGEAPEPSDAPVSEEAAPQGMIALLAGGEAVFGIFSGEKTREQGARMAANRNTDFVFYSLESGPFDLETMAEYVSGMVEAVGADDAHPIALRIPPIRDGAEDARERTAAAVSAGVEAVVFPHVETAEEAALAVEALGPGSWPGDSQGSRTAILIVEDRVGIENAEAIAATPGVGVVIPGPGDLRRAYEGDMEAVEAAIQRVLAACKANGVVCGITAGVDDIGSRIEQGFGLIIVTQEEALEAGLAAAGRS